VRPTPPVPARWSGAGPDLANIYLHARYYDSALGIFLSPDPIGADSNTYRYSYGDSVNFSDPTGLDPSIPFDPCLVWDTLCRGEGATVPGIGGSPGGADLTWWYSWGLSVAALSFSRRLPIDVFSSVSAALIRGPEAEREQEPGPQRAQLLLPPGLGASPRHTQALATSRVGAKIEGTAQRRTLASGTRLAYRQGHPARYQSDREAARASRVTSGQFRRNLTMKLMS
jgi:RHS repeat-associated protein